MDWFTSPNDDLAFANENLLDYPVDRFELLVFFGSLLTAWCFLLLAA